MLTLLSHMILRAQRENRDFPDHLKEHADRYIRSPRAHKGARSHHHDTLLPFRQLW
ncbi:hypothetical protein C8N43_2786 [Litoreibacter ponti]|uniref:Uncharacterized protein n=1 Tax=Litoreibacter ponti TaxID=1510457 RepID=A0A2T6BPT6_9RHOB|nr:hypothetical protein [Litoreibacter ponti]PTX58110.1 hypothetical protein C8N43_2786 [Litoreibacter ponti]